jgi:hypothetical protein
VEVEDNYRLSITKDVEEKDVNFFKVLCRFLPGGTEENHETLSQDRPSPSCEYHFQVFNPLKPSGNYIHHLLSNQ